MKKLFFFCFFSFFILKTQAQRPKMHLKAKIGLQSLSFVYKEEAISREYFGGFHGGFGFRVMQKKKMGEINFDFIRNYLYLEQPENGSIIYKQNSFELPINIGYITLKKPLIKHFLYGGVVTEFKIKSKLIFLDLPDTDPINLKPRELGLSNPNFHFRFGTQIDIAMFNLDLNYSLGLNKSLKENYRTQSHSLKFSLGLIF